MQYLATPLAMTQSFFQETLGYGEVGTSQDYVERQTVAIDEPTVVDVLNHVWDLFQNVGPGHMTPDGGRSLMVGDIIRVTDVNGENVTLHRVDSCGFSEVQSLKSIFPRATAALRGEYDDMSYAEMASEFNDVADSE